MKSKNYKIENKKFMYLGQNLRYFDKFLIIIIGINKSLMRG